MNKARKSPWRILYKFHRYSGLCVAVIAIFLALTGIALNHTEDLQLDIRFVKSAALLDWYGIDAEINIAAYKTKNHWLTQLSGQVYFDARPLSKTEAFLLGAIETNGFIIIAHSGFLTLLTEQGQVIEKIEQNRRVQRIGIDQTGAIIIDSSEGIYSSSDGLLSWQPGASGSIIWATAAPLPKQLKQQLQQLTRQQILPYERVMLDLHSGRLFGKAGVFIVDLSGVFLILLAISGTWIWLRHKLKSLYHKRRNH